MRYTNLQTVLQEVPGEISLALTISGCPLACRGCHSADSWRATLGQPLDSAHFRRLLARYQGLLSCVCFLGGEWQPQQLRALLQIAKQQQLKTCLYTGLTLDEVPAELLLELDFIKTGRWQAERGGLDRPSTNQRFYRLSKQPFAEDLTHLFTKN